MSDNNELSAELKPQAEVTVVDRYADSRFILDSLGSLSEIMGEEEAEAFLDANSITRHGLAKAYQRSYRPIIRSD